MELGLLGSSGGQFLEWGWEGGAGPTVPGITALHLHVRWIKFFTEKLFIMKNFKHMKVETILLWYRDL